MRLPRNPNRRPIPVQCKFWPILLLLWRLREPMGYVRIKGRPLIWRKVVIKSKKELDDDFGVFILG